VDLLQRRRKSVWMLTAIGKRSKKRRCRRTGAISGWISWTQRGCTTVFPATVPSTPAAAARHGAGKARPGYTKNAIYALVKSALIRVRRKLEAVDPDGKAVRVTVEDIKQLASTSPHALRHTFGSIAVCKGIPLNVVQQILGHED
jgi:hypothetical protein